MWGVTTMPEAYLVSDVDQQPCQKRNPAREALGQHVLVCSVRPLAFGPEPIERRHAHRRCEVAVRTATRAAFVKLNAHGTRVLTRFLEEGDYRRRSLHRRPIEPARDFEPRAVELWL